MPAKAPKPAQAGFFTSGHTLPYAKGFKRRLEPPTLLSDNTSDR